MKKTLALLLTVVLLFGICVFATPVTASTSNRLGDVDNDGWVTAGDARLCLRYSVDLEELDQASVYAANVDGDDNISAGDAREILRFSVGLEVEHIKQHPAEDPDYDPDAPTEPDDDDEITADDLPEGSKILYLTFDDGPSKYTETILDILDEYNAKATFFVIYQSNYSAQYKMIVDRGQTIALHAYSHEYSDIYTSTTAYFKDLQKISDHVYNLTGVRSNLIRFPGGSSNTVSRNYCYGIMTQLSKLVGDYGLVYFDWNADSTDASGNNVAAETIYYNSIGYTEDEVVLLMHDTNAKGTTVLALPYIIEHYQDRGYYVMALTENSETAHHPIAN
ncbi:MAG: polysaccharide deacetylase family protein [Clostridia bacterium]|nr:polysaccharide deacetylase family protein [Clostridia bacterium]